MATIFTCLQDRKTSYLLILLTFLPCIIFSQQQKRLIRNYISSKQIHQFKKADLSDFSIDNIDSSASLKADIVKFQQTYKGLPIYNAVGTAVIKNNDIVFYSDAMVEDYRTSASQIPGISKNEALKKTAVAFNNDEISDLQFQGNTVLGSNNAVSEKLVYLKLNSDLKLAYELSFKEPASPNYWNVLIDAHSGEVISKDNLTLSCNFHNDAYSRPLSYFSDSQSTDENFQLKSPDNAMYRVFPLPVEAPTFGSRSLVSNPWILASSPEGWHSDGITSYTITRGNNVYAYEDSANKDLPGFSPDGGANRNFDFPFSSNGSSAFNRNAAITNLFYTANRVHDIFYRFGFTESARNFQQNNFGKGGTGNDYLLAEAQDGGGESNANFTTPADGNKPLMQMYLWTTVNRFFYYNAPASAIPRIPQASAAQFGPPLDATGITGDVALSSVIDACSPLSSNSLNGKIALIERGGGSNCTFVSKVKNAQNAGAIAAIIYNNAAAASFPSSMGGTDATITIPSVLISNSEGEFIKSQLNNSITVNVTLKSDPATAVTPDGSFDNGIIIHEYGHGISNRLTGNGYSCLLKSQSKEQMGEGWSDFFALMLTNQPGDNADVPRSIGTYANGQNNYGSGFRPAKYSPDFSVNNYTYGDTNGMEIEEEGEIVPDVHRIGFVWASMLWDLHWKYAEKYGYSSDVTANPNNGSARMLQLITDAMKLQTCNPTFIDARNAVLSAEMLTTKGENRCMIWKTFARRGLGLNALAGNKMNIHDQVEDFSVPKDCTDGNANIEIDRSKIAIYPVPAKDEFFIYLKDFTIGSLYLEIYDMSGKLVHSLTRSSEDSRIPVSTKDLENGTYIVKLSAIGVNYTQKIVVQR